MGPMILNSSLSKGSSVSTDKQTMTSEEDRERRRLNRQRNLATKALREGGAFKLKVVTSKKNNKRDKFNLSYFRNKYEEE